ncbi:tetratricopeptide repeat protein [Aestuariirhabdus litorea]|uniref:Uncharacterized protein n=1 Tax=Aestuariirhabdus litorea TaxID=2528527 RepID=A0A3P3VX13_9GAMM|nr:tetratricopeptide repeat protein [Aestuariirhabdus litorea]RRJ85243.1 hypothetical protein D0544_09305 [Aestuariirhabdus litorea]RWW98464.1 tetratricopeptide repeat protein [Endozoicomonadaceae bacterium GTF-13]
MKVFVGFEGGRLARLMPWFVALLGFLYGLAPIVDTDVWMHLSLGRYITDSGFPEYEPFAFSVDQEPFFFSSWLFAVATYALFQLSGYAGLVVLKASFISLLFVVLYRYALYRSSSPWISFLIIVAAMPLLLPRFVLRPDLLFFLILVSIFYLMALGRQQWRWLLLVPWLAMLWSNVHSSVIVVLVPLVYGTLKAVFETRGESWSLSRPDLRQLSIFACLGVISLLATLINPNGLDQFLYGFSVMGQTFFKEMIIELLPPSWEQNALHLSIGLGVALFQAVFVIYSLIKKQLGLSKLMDVSMVLVFFGLFLTSSRFFYPFVVVSIPVVVYQLSRVWLGVASYMEDYGRRVWCRAIALIAVGGVMIYSLHELPAPGLSMSPVQIPEEAMTYLDQVGHRGALFNSFRLGGYIIWRDFPSRRVFVDPRGKIPQSLLEEHSSGHNSFDVLTELSDRFGFSFAVLARGTMGFGYPDAALSGFPNPDWALVYWDDKAVVLARRDRPEAARALRDEYRVFHPEFVAMLGTSKFNLSQTSQLLEEIERNLELTESLEAKISKAVFWISRQRFDRAESILAPLVADNEQRSKSLASYWMGALSKLKGDLAAARRYYHQALSMAKFTGVYLELAELSMALGDYSTGIDYVDQLLEREPNNLQAHALKVVLLRRAGKEDQEVKALEARLEMLQNLDRLVESGIAAYRRGELELAEDLYQKALAEDPERGPAYYNLAILARKKGEAARAVDLYSKAVQFDTNLTRAYFSIAQIYQEEGASDRAIEFYRKYVDAVPAGRLSREARAALKAYEVPN